MSAALLGIVPAAAATKTVDLDAQSTNGAESQCDLNVLSTFPAKVENVVTNRAIGNAFDFSWPSAGPGGFTSSAAAGSAGGVGAKWTWTTAQSIYSYTGSTCPKDVCFLKTTGPDALPSTCTSGCKADGASLTVGKGANAGEFVLDWTGGDAPYKVYRSSVARGITAPANQIGETTGLRYTDVPPGGVIFYRVAATTCLTPKPCASNADCEPASEGTCVSRGPFSVPGRSLVANDVTVSSASLTSSLITFFSPPNELFRVTSVAQPGGALETLANNSTTPLTVQTEAYPPGCCEEPGRLNCDGACVDYLTDPLNCGACGHACGDLECCVDGNCVPECPEGQILCDGQCRDPLNDSDHCGACGNACGDGTCCTGGACVSVCAEGSLWCDGQCADVRNDNDNCGGCGIVCGEGTCCTDGACVSVCPEGWIWCGGQCVDPLNDSANCGTCGSVCTGPGCCVNGSCTVGCDPGRTLCGDLCYDLQSDPSNCGACGNICASDSVCAGGQCIPCNGQGGAKDACDNYCTNLNTDPYNCGECGRSCNLGCPSGFKGVCSNGQSCKCVAGTPAPPPPSNIPPPTDPFCPNPNPSPAPVPGICPNPTPSGGPVPGVCPNPAPSGPLPLACPVTGPPPPIVAEAPVCTVLPETTVVPAGGTTTTCRPGGLVFREVPTSVSVCGDGIPGPDGSCQGDVSNVSTGTFMRFVPDPTIEVGRAFVTPSAVRVTAENSNDGLIQPGETASVLLSLVNAGPATIVGASATLVAGPVDLTDDGVDNPVTVGTGSVPVSFGTIPGTSPAGPCEAVTLQPVTGAAAFTVTVPSGHPGDTSTPFRVQVTGTVDGAPWSMDMPLSLGIADLCVPGGGSRDYDALNGLLSPMGRLVPLGDPVVFGSKEINLGSTQPLKLQVFCGGAPLGTADLDPPEIVGISEEIRGPLNPQDLDLNDSANPDDPYFRYNADAGQWIFNMRTDNLGAGRFTLTIRIAGRKDYVTGFVVRDSF